ncbi:MAG: bifunctional demethylmenaquinone methyltransferase/2-methoxy-6-polyprenyl-1,4-benzoquinol methylase UbiE [Acidobacteriota bacterium]
MGTDHTKYIEEKKSAWQIFDRIYKRYDLLNHVLSLGIDFRWRKKLSDLIGDKKGGALLDLATGTGDVLFSLLKHSGGFRRTVGVDMSFNMLMYAEGKNGKKGKGEVGFVLGDANNIPVKTGSFDIATMAFGIRNISEPVIALKDINRTLSDGGRALILEFSLPENKFLRGVHLFYLRYILPVIGKIVSGDVDAYRYLNKTIETFPYGENFIKLMMEAGFTDCKRFPMTFGVVTIYRGVKRNG